MIVRAVFGTLTTLAACGNFTLDEPSEPGRRDSRRVDAQVDAPPSVDAPLAVELPADAAPDVEDAASIDAAVPCVLAPGLALSFAGPMNTTLAEHGWVQGPFLISREDGLVTADNGLGADDAYALCRNTRLWSLHDGVRITYQFHVESFPRGDDPVPILQLGGPAGEDTDTVVLTIGSAKKLRLTMRGVTRLADTEELVDLSDEYLTAVIALRRSPTGETEYCVDLEDPEGCKTVNATTAHATLPLTLEHFRFGLPLDNREAVTASFSLRFSALDPP